MVRELQHKILRGNVCYDTSAAKTVRISITPCPGTCSVNLLVPAVRIAQCHMFMNPLDFHSRFLLYLSTFVLPSVSQYIHALIRDHRSIMPSPYGSHSWPSQPSSSCSPVSNLPQGQSTPQSPESRPTSPSLQSHPPPHSTYLHSSCHPMPVSMTPTLAPRSRIRIQSTQRKDQSCFHRHGTNSPRLQSQTYPCRWRIRSTGSRCSAAQTADTPPARCRSSPSDYGTETLR